MEWEGLILDVDFGNDYDNEYTGACLIEVNRKQHAEVYGLCQFANWDEEPSFDSECDDEDETVYMTNADHMICFLAAAQDNLPEGTKVSLSYHGTPYWFYHDLIHAEYDSGDGTDIYVDADSETRALVMGAKLAAENGVSVAEIVRELAQAEKEYKERFGFETDALVSFLDCCTYA